MAGSRHPRRPIIKGKGQAGINVLVVDDSAMVRQVLSNVLSR